ncbi:MAG: cytochrome c oxidase assembly protein [Tagaea sp.]
MTDATPRPSNARTALMAGGIVVGMLALAFASVPLYRLFCQITGFGGTPLVADAAPGTRGERIVTVRFDANVMGGPNPLPWRFEGPRPVQVQVGEDRLIQYRATTRGAVEATGTATFNVTPLKAAPYFHKIACFCFTDQALAPGESMDMPVSFYVDPAIEKDVNLRDVTTITLSYTFHRAAPKTADASAPRN